MHLSDTGYAVLLDLARTRVADVSREDAAALAGRLEGDADVTLALVGSGWARVPGDTTARAVLLAGVQPGAEAVGPEKLLHGRYLTADDVAGNARTAVVPSSLASWYGADAASLPGRVLEVDGRDHRIVGVVDDEAETVRLRVPLGAALRSELERPDRRAQVAIRARRVSLAWCSAPTAAS